MMYTSQPKGFFLVEAILASSLFAFLAVGLIGALLYGQESAVMAGNQARAALFAEEGVEAVRYIRDREAAVGTPLLPSGTYGLVLQNGRWELQAASDTSDIFTRRVVIATVGDRTDVTITVNWQQNRQRTGTVSVVSNYTNWQRGTSTPPPPPPPTSSATCTLSATPASIVSGQSTLLSWSSQNATSASLAPSVGTVPTSGTRTVTPTQNTTYTLSVSGTGGNGSCQTSVVVTTAPPPPPPANRAPIAVDDAYYTTGTRLGLTTETLFVLLNDTDADLDSLTITAVTTPTGGATAVIQGGNRIVLSKIPVGTVTFSYTISDGRGGTDTATVTYTKEIQDECSIRFQTCL